MTSILYFIYSMCHSVTKGENVIECYSVRGWRILWKSPCLMLLISYCEFDNREDGSSISRSLQANYIDKILTLLQFNRNAFLDFSDYFETETNWFSAITSSLTCNQTETTEMLKKNQLSCLKIESDHL